MIFIGKGFLCFHEVFIKGVKKPRFVHSFSSCHGAIVQQLKKSISQYKPTALRYNIFMKIIICGSISAAKEILNVKERLLEIGYEVEIPEGVKRPKLQSTDATPVSEKAETKIKYDLIRGYYKKIKDHDAVLIVNPEKKGIKGYVGGNTLIEMAFAHVLNKKLFCLYPPSANLSYSSEIFALQPIILNGNLDKIRL